MCNGRLASDHIEVADIYFCRIPTRIRFGRFVSTVVWKRVLFCARRIAVLLKDVIVRRRLQTVGFEKTEYAAFAETNRANTKENGRVGGVRDVRDD